MTNTTKPDFSEREQGTIFGNLVFGLKVVLSELKWLVLRGTRAFELRQMNKRLDEEYAALGRAVAQSVDNGADDIAKFGPAADTAFRQVSFLTEEIDYLRREKESLRGEFLKERNSNLGIDDREE